MDARARAWAASERWCWGCFKFNGHRFHALHVELSVSIRLIDGHQPQTVINHLHSFRITYRIILREKELHFHIGVYNPSKELAFSFNLLLHTYLKVPDVRKCQITGLHGCTFIDKVSLGEGRHEDYAMCSVNMAFRRATVQFTRRAAKWWRSTSGPIGYTSTRTKSTSSPMWCRGGRCDCRNTIFRIQVKDYED